jgi:hypothetical protein
MAIVSVLGPQNKHGPAMNRPGLHRGRVRILAVADLQGMRESSRQETPAVFEHILEVPRSMSNRWRTTQQMNGDIVTNQNVELARPAPTYSILCSKFRPRISRCLPRTEGGCKRPPDL